MRDNEILLSGKFYHIYNRGINGCNIFQGDTDFQRFISLYDKYIPPIADTYAWVTLPNHFHFLVKIKENIVYRFSNANRSYDAVRFNEIKWETIDRSACEAPDNVTKIPEPYLHFSHLCNAYTKYFNKRHKRHGALFERAFKRKIITETTHLKNVILYIHNNPVHHGFCKTAADYPWSSYLSCISIKPTRINRDQVIGWFNSKAEFCSLHDEKMDLGPIEKMLGI